MNERHGKGSVVQAGQDSGCDMRIASIAISRRKGTPKATVGEASLLADYGIEGDAHAGPWHRQVSFLAADSIEGAQRRGLDVVFGSFAENVATRGIDWDAIPVGTRIGLGDSALVEITQKGKDCLKRCAIYYLSGDCIMPREGVFGRVVSAGKIRRGDSVHIVERS